MSVFWQSPCLPSAVSHHVSLLAVTMSAFNPLDKKVGFWKELNTKSFQATVHIFRALAPDSFKQKVQQRKGNRDWREAKPTTLRR